MVKALEGKDVVQMGALKRRGIYEGTVQKPNHQRHMAIEP